MKLTGMIYTWVGILLFTNLQPSTSANYMPAILISQQVEDQDNSTEKQDLRTDKTVVDLFDEASKKYSPSFYEATTIKSQFKDLLGVNPALESNIYMYPDKAAFLESSAIRSLYHFIIKEQSPLKNIRINNTGDTYLFDSSI